MGRNGAVAYPSGISGDLLSVLPGRLSNPCPSLRLAAYISNQATSGDGRVLILDRDSAGEGAIDIWNESLSLPDIWFHLLEVAEKIHADEVGRAAARRIRFSLIVRPDNHAAPAVTAWADAHVDAVLGVAPNIVLLSLLGRGQGRRE
jgi:hypothetical protein